MARIGPGRPEPPKKTTVNVPTGKLVLAIVEMYSSEEKEMQKLAGDLSACILESYNDRELMVKDILGTYITKRLIIAAMRVDMKRLYPEESRILSEIFGVFLFGEKL